MKQNILNQSEIVRNLGFDTLNPMQTDTISASKSHNNLLLIAPTGSGKTVAYLLSSLHKLSNKPGVQLLILAPTRELVLQIEAVVKAMKLPLKTNICYGGHPFSVERKNLSIAPTILIGTPGRIEDHIRRETFDVSTIEHVIFDEFDKSLEIGFSTQMNIITQKTPNIVSRILVSATQEIAVPDFIPFENPHTIKVSKEASGVLTYTQHVVEKEEKLEGLIAIIKTLPADKNAIIFVNHRDACNRISEHMKAEGISFSNFHGGLEQDQRELELFRFRNGTSQLLIATDIAARGIDIPDLDYVIHYQLPPQEAGFIHRNGRTARMTSSGVCILIRTTQETLPPYLKETPKPFTINPIERDYTPRWVTFYIGKGKKDRINKVDIVGYLLQFKFMKKEDLGLIEVKDFASYVAINRHRSRQLLTACRSEKIKNKTVKVAIAR